MINGLHVDVSSDELKGLLLKRLQYHEEKTNFYTRQLEELEKANAALREEELKMGKSGSRSPTDSIKEAVTRHQDQASYYRFMAAHVVPNETYRLDEGDLVRLGIQSQRHY